MTKEFYEHLFKKQQLTGAIPPNEHIAAWALHVIRLLYPEQSNHSFSAVIQLESEFIRLQDELTKIMNATRECNDCNNQLRSKTFFDNLPELYRTLNTDIKALITGDPAAKSEFEIVRAYPGFYAISFYRLAHSLLKLEIPLIPRILTEHAHSKTGIDIHPGAEIDEYLYIDHGTGIVIGETTKIGKHVKLYQGVTLGALSVNKGLASSKRHPTVDDNVVIYAGATILGGETIIGHNSIIGGNVWLTTSVPPHSTVYNETRFKVVERKIQN